MSTNDTANALIEYMSKKALDVANLNATLDQFNDYVPIPSLTRQQIRFVRHEPLRLYGGSREGHASYGTYVFGADSWPWEEQPPPAPLETRALTEAEREELERILAF